MKYFLKRLLPVLLGINALCGSLRAQTDSLELVLTSRIDSLVKMWYIQNLPPVNPTGTADTAYTLPYEPDSVFISRLNSIPAKIELPFNDIVRKYITFYLRQPERLSLFLGLSEYYFPQFEEVFDMFEVPIELKNLSVIESALNPKARSWVGAAGLWQFMPGTGKMYDLKITSFVDERSDPLKSTYAAASYLKDMNEMYNDWTLVIAAYNCGPGNVNRAIRRSGGVPDFWRIYKYLPRETRSYVPAFIAATYVMNFAYEYKIYPRKVNLPALTDTVMINDKLHFKQIADVLHLPIEQIRDLNPHYKRDIIPGSESDPCHLFLPFEQLTAFIQQYDSIANYQRNTLLNPAALSGYSVVSNTSSDKNYIYYTIRPGDNLWLIAKKFQGVSAYSIMRLNGLTNQTVKRLKPGNKIKVKRK